jgi:cytosine/adenosine deaminase-related metal-dependent hydrolase
VSEAIEKVGLRGVLCYEVTDRGGPQERDRGLEENRAFLKSVLKSRGNDERSSSTQRRGAMFRAMVGAHASFTLSDNSLEACAELMREFNAGLHIHAAEDLCDVEDARSKHGMGIVERLARFNALNGRTVLAHGIHLGERDIAIARGAGAWFAHNPRSNMNNQVGYAPVARFGERVTLGTDGIGADMFEEARFAFFKARDGRAEVGPAEWVRALANNQRLASLSFGVELGALDEGAAADLIVLDYDSPTPVLAENLAWHFAFGLSSASVESVMVGGRFVIKGGESLLDEASLYEQAREASEKLWRKL